MSEVRLGKDTSSSEFHVNISDINLEVHTCNDCNYAGNCETYGTHFAIITLLGSPARGLLGQVMKLANCCQEANE